MDYILNRHEINDFSSGRIQYDYETAAWNEDFYEAAYSRSRWLSHSLALPASFEEFLQLFCLSVVSAYILYFLLSFILKPRLVRNESELKTFPTMKHLRHGQFQDCVVPVKVKNFCKVAPVHREKPSIQNGGCVSADMSKPLLPDPCLQVSGQEWYDYYEDSHVQHL